MITKYKNKKVKINKPLKGYKPGAEIAIKFDGDKPKDRYWRDRLTDSKIDNCVEVVSSTTSKPKNEVNDADR